MMCCCSFDEIDIEEGGQALLSVEAINGIALEAGLAISGRKYDLILIILQNSNVVGQPRLIE